MNKVKSALLKQILDHPTDVLALADSTGLRIAYFNENFKKYFNLSEEAIENKTVYEICGLSVPLETHERLKSDLENIGVFIDTISSKYHQFFFTKVNCPDKKCYLIRVSGQDNNWLMQQFKMLLEKNVAGVFQGYLNGNMISCNQAFASMLGFLSPEDLLNTNAYSFYPSPAERDAFIYELTTSKILSNYEIRLRKTTGEIITCLENTYLESDNQGKEIITGTIIDISAKKKAEAALSESESRLRVISQVTSEGVVFIEDDHIVDANEQFASIFGFEKSLDVIGKSILDFIVAFDLRRIKNALEISSTNRTEIRAFSPSGKPLFLDVSGNTISTNDNTRIVLVVNDYTARKRSEYALEQTVVRLRNLLEKSPNAVLIITDDAIRYANSAALNLLGASEEDEIYDSSFLKFISLVFRREVRNDLMAIRQGEEIGYKEIKIVNLDGQEFDAAINSTLTVYENKPSIQISLTNISARNQLVQEQMRVRIIEEINSVLKTEIQEHKITQQKLISQQNYNRSLIESSLDMILASNEEDKIIEFNKAAQLKFGYTVKEMIGKNSEVLYHDKNQCEFVRKQLTKNGEFSGEITNVKKNGEIFTSLISASLIRDESGRVIGTMGVSKDITEARKHERLALEQKAKLESIFNSTENIMMWTMDHVYRLTTMNLNFGNWAKATLQESVKPGMDISEMLSKHVHQDYYQGQLEAFSIALKGRPQQFELALVDESDKPLWLQIFLNPVYLEDRLEEISCLVYDISERKQIEKRVREALKEKEVLLQEIHHRVKNNLQVISSILNLQSSFVNDEKTLEILQESQNRIKSMSFIHETLYRTADFSNIDFSEYLRTLSNNLIQSYRLNDCHIDFQSNLDEVSIHIDQAIPCGLIVNELISNALKYAFLGRKEGKIVLDLNKKGNQLSFAVCDNGVGLPKDFHYEKTDSLGVQLVYTLVEQLDSRIEVETGETGTRFMVTFEMQTP